MGCFCEDPVEFPNTRRDECWLEPDCVVVQNEEEHPGRDQWYIARFVADDAPDWNVGSYLRTEEAGPSYRTVVVEAEISREKVPLRNCYKHVGQRASVRVNSGANRELTGGRRVLL